MTLKDFPAMIPLWTIPIAIVTGNCVILKPSERAPGAAMILADLAKQAGLPDGVLNVIHGAAKTVDFILDEPIIQAISFVGGNRAGEYIYRRGTANGKRVQANLGAKNHAVVVPDCDEDQAIPAIIGAAFGAAGQRCMALTTLLMVGSTRDWLPDLVAQARRLKVDGGFEADVDLGPVISRFSKDRIEELIASAEHEGADILLDGRGVLPEKNPLGNWVRLTFLYPFPPSISPSSLSLHYFSPSISPSSLSLSLSHPLFHPLHFIHPFPPSTLYSSLSSSTFHPLFHPPLFNLIFDDGHL